VYILWPAVSEIKKKVSKHISLFYKYKVELGRGGRWCTQAGDLGLCDRARCEGRSQVPGQGCSRHSQSGRASARSHFPEETAAVRTGLPPFLPGTPRRRTRPFSLFPTLQGFSLERAAADGKFHSFQQRRLLRDNKHRVRQPPERHRPAMYSTDHTVVSPVNEPKFSRQEIIPRISGFRLLLRVSLASPGHRSQRSTSSWF